MRNIFLDDEAIEEDVDDLSIQTGSEEQFAASETPASSFGNSTRQNKGSSPKQPPNSYGQFLLKRLQGMLQPDGAAGDYDADLDGTSRRSSSSLGASFEGPNMKDSPSLSSEDRAAVDRDLARLTSVRSDEEDDDEEEEDDDAEDLADFIVSDTYVESEMTESALAEEEGSIASTESSVNPPRARLRRIRRSGRKSAPLPPHPRFAFADNETQDVGAVKMAGGACAYCASRKAAKTPYTVQLAVSLNVISSTKPPQATLGRTHGLPSIKTEARKATILLERPAPPVPGSLSPRRGASVQSAPSTSPPPLDYVELMKAAAVQSLTVTLPDGFGGEYEIIPSEQWSNLEAEGDTDFHNIVYVRGGNKRRGKEDFLILYSTSSETGPRPMRFGPMRADITARQITTNISMIPIGEIDRIFNPTEATPASPGARKEHRQPQNRHSLEEAVKPGSLRAQKKKKIDARRVVQSATKKLRREHTWPSRLGHRLRLFHRIIQGKNAPLMEVARNAGYAYLHGPSNPLPSSAPPLPDPIFPSREQLRRLFRPYKPCSDESKT